MKQNLISAFTITVLLLIIVAMCVGIFGSDDKKTDETTVATTVTTTVPANNTTVPVATPTTALSATDTVTEQTTAVVVTENTTAVSSNLTTTQITSENTAVSNLPQTTKEIIDKYTFLVNRFKQEKPSYKKKEYQDLPEEYRNFDGAVNVILNIASNYMVSEEDCEELVRVAGAPEITYDMPIHNTDVGCVLTDYDAVSWAKCEDVGDGTYKITFSLKEEINAEPTPADTLIPVSAHGAVMQPMSISDIMVEVKNVTDSLPVITLNDFSLYYRDCEFECVYNPETDEVISITHHIVIDIVADIELLSSHINGTARLLNEMLIYDITW